MIIIGVHQSTPYAPICVLHQLALRQDFFNFPTVFDDICKLNHHTSDHRRSTLATLWDSLHIRVLGHPQLVSIKTQAMTPAYEQWLLYKPLVQLAIPSASTSSNKRQCTKSTSSSHTEPSHTQVEHKQALSDLDEERTSHAQTKATLKSEMLLRTEAKVSHESTQH